MKKLLLIAFLILPFVSFGEDIKQLKHNTITYIDDFANLFTDKEEEAMDFFIKEFKKKSTVEFSIVTVNNLNGMDVADFTLQLARQWGVGGKSNNGIMILVSKDPRKLRTEVGYGLEGDLPDMITKRHHTEFAVPYLKNNEYGKGITALLVSYMQRLDPEVKKLREVEEAKSRAEAEKAWSDVMDGFLWILSLSFFAFIAWRIYRYVRRKQEEKLRIERERAAKLEQERLHKEQLWSNTIKKISEFKAFAVEFESFNLDKEFVSSLKSFNNHDLTVKDELSRGLITAKVDNINQNKIMTLHNKFIEIKKDIYKIDGATQDLDSINVNFDKYIQGIKILISKHPEFKLDSSEQDLRSQFNKILVDANQKIKEGAIAKSNKDWSKLSNIISDFNLLTSQANIINNRLSTKIVEIDRKQKEVESIPYNIQQFEQAFNHYKRLSYISPAFKSKESDFKQKIQSYHNNMIGSAGIPTMFTILFKYENLAKELDFILNIARLEEKKENDRLQAIENERIRKERDLRIKREEEEAEERRRKRKKQDEEDEERRRNSYASSSYGSSDWGSSSSSSSGSDFGGGSFGGSGSSSDY